MNFLVVITLLASQSDREAEMFGEEPPPAEAQKKDVVSSPADPSDPPPATPAPAADPRDDMFGDETVETLKPGLATSSGLLDDADNALAIGGQLFLRMNGSFREDERVPEGTITGPSLLDAFADVRPTDRVRAYAQLRFTFDYTVDEGETGALGQPLVPFDLQLAQAWTKFDVGQIAYVTAGRQRIRWGTGRFWNPTDFVNQEIRNSVDFFDQRVGVDILKVHFPFEALGWNLYLIGTFDGIDVLEDTGVAARAEFVFGEMELALSSAVKKDAPLRFGADISAGVWLFDVRAEGVLSRGIGRKLFKGDLDFAEGTFPEEVDEDDDDWYFQGVTGAEAQFKYTDTDAFFIGVEYFYNQAGYDSAELYPFLFTQPGSFLPLYLGRHYGAVYASAPSPFDFNDLTVTVSTLGNLSDRSFLSRLDLQYVLLQYLTLNAFVAGHWGQVGELKLGVDIDPVPGVLPDGFKLANDMVDVGVSARVNF